MLVKPYDDDWQLYLDYEVFFSSLFGGDAPAPALRSEWALIESACVDSACSLPRLRNSLGLDDAAYLCLALAVAYEMGNLRIGSLTYYHAAVACDRVLNAAEGLFALFAEKSLLWLVSDESPLLERPMRLRPGLSVYLLSGKLPLPQGRSLVPPDQTDRSGFPAERIDELLTKSAAVLCGEANELERGLKAYCAFSGCAAYCVGSDEEDTGECLLLAFVSGSLLYLDSPGTDTVRRLLSWSGKYPVRILIGCRANAYGLPQIDFSRERSISIAAINGEGLKEQLELLCNYAMHSSEAFARYGISGSIYYGAGTAAVFYGKSGTGKTMAANAVANRLGRPMITACLSEIFDKYIGETEKNIELLFEQAKQRNAVLFFDEAETLFSKRTSVESSHDKYANLPAAYLLKKIEESGGLLLLSTNLINNMDDAFLRRMQFVIRFPMPGADERKAYWSSLLPHFLKETLSLLAEEELSYARIKETVKLAAVLSLRRGRTAIAPEDVREACGMETRKNC